MAFTPTPRPTPATHTWFDLPICWFPSTLPLHLFTSLWHCTAAREETHDSLLFYYHACSRTFLPPAFSSLPAPHKRTGIASRAVYCIGSAAQLPHGLHTPRLPLLGQQQARWRFKRTGYGDVFHVILYLYVVDSCVALRLHYTYKRVAVKTAVTGFRRSRRK